MVTTDEFITSLGGPRLIAERLNITRNAVQRWVYPKPVGCAGRIPSKHWPLLVELAATRGHEITLDALMNMSAKPRIPRSKTATLRVAA
jgi:hypothetical protein